MPHIWRMTMTRFCIISILTLSLAMPGVINASSIESSYTKLDFEKECTIDGPAKDEDEAGMGGSYICSIDNTPIIFFQEGDMRQSAGFGAPKQFQTFGPFNHMNTTIEWRSINNKPFAAIVRWFIANMNHDTGNFDKSLEAQVLVVHRVAANPDDLTCIVALVDARANRNANQLAREVADTLTSLFDCRADRPRYHGKRGKYAHDLSIY